MTIPSSQSGSFENAVLDPRLYGELRAQANRDPQQALGEVAHRFEALFIQSMLKSARSAALVTSSFEGRNSKTYQDMLDRHWAEIVAGSGGTGIAELLMRQLGDSKQMSPAETSVVPASKFEQPLPADMVQRPAGDRFALHNAVNSALPMAAMDSAHGGDIDGPVGFVRQLWVHASKAAQQLGVAPEVLLAQAALETGWGRSLPERDGGGNSFNLFGIKASSGWQGQTATVATTEFIDGIPVRLRTPFRAYENYQASFEDYVQLLQGSSRYRDALQSTASADAFLGALQRAGYATDPTYAHKIQLILHGESMQQALEALHRDSVPPSILSSEVRSAHSKASG